MHRLAFLAIGLLATMPCWAAGSGGHAAMSTPSRPATMFPPPPTGPGCPTVSTSFPCFGASEPDQRGRSIVTRPIQGNGASIVDPCPPHVFCRIEF
jgi:hypothetical protein